MLAFVYEFEHNVSDDAALDQSVNENQVRERALVNAIREIKESKRHPQDVKAQMLANLENRLESARRHQAPSGLMLDRQQAMASFQGSLKLIYDAERDWLRVEQIDGRDLDFLFEDSEEPDYVTELQRQNYKKNSIQLMKDEHSATLNLDSNIVMVAPPTPVLKKNWLFMAIAVTDQWKGWSDVTVQRRHDGISISGKEGGVDYTLTFGSLSPLMLTTAVQSYQGKTLSEVEFSDYITVSDIVLPARMEWHKFDLDEPGRVVETKSLRLKRIDPCSRVSREEFDTLPVDETTGEFTVTK